MQEDGTVSGLPDGHDQPSDEEQAILHESFEEIRDQLWPKIVNLKINPPPAGSYLDDPDVLKRTWHRYRADDDDRDEVHFLVERIDFTPDFGKPKRCLTWVYLDTLDRHGWHQGEPEGYSFPPYNLTSPPAPNATVLVVEGEKTVDAILATNYDALHPWHGFLTRHKISQVVTWRGGAAEYGPPDRTDWSMLNREDLRFIFLADNDRPGFSAMKRIRTNLSKYGPSGLAPVSPDTQGVAV